MGGSLGIRNRQILLCSLIVAFPALSQETDTADQKQAQQVQSTQLSKPEIAPAVTYPPALQYPPAQQGAPALQSVPSAASPWGQQAAPGNNNDDYLQGRIAGAQDARGHAAWLLAGMPGITCYGIGCLGVIASVLIPPEPPVSGLLGKSTAYILGYTEGYKSKGRWKNGGWSTLGCAIGTAVTIGIIFLFDLSNTYYYY